MRANQSIGEIEKVLRGYRKRNSRQFPPSLWTEIGALRKRHTLTELSKRTGISVAYLRRKLGDETAVFCELKPAVLARESVSIEAVGVGVQTIVEIRRPDGNQLVARVNGATLSEIIARFIQT